MSYMTEGCWITYWEPWKHASRNTKNGAALIDTVAKVEGWNVWFEFRNMLEDAVIKPHENFSRWKAVISL